MFFYVKSISQKKIFFRENDFSEKINNSKMYFFIYSLCPEFIRVAEAYPASIPIITTTTASTTTSTTSTSSTTTSTSVEKPEPEVKPLTLPADIGSSPPSKGGLTSPSAALGGSYSNLDDEQKTAINR